jgi:hypothetical protein
MAKRQAFLVVPAILMLGLLGACESMGPPRRPPGEVPAVMAPLPPPEIGPAHSSKTFYARYPTGGYYTEFHAPDGRTILIEPDGEIYRGTWAVDGSRICYTYPRLNAGAPYCFEVRRGDGVLAHYFLDGPKQGQPAAVVVGAVEGNDTGVPLE